MFDGMSQIYRPAPLAVAVVPEAAFYMIQRWQRGIHDTVVGAGSFHFWSVCNELLQFTFDIINKAFVFISYDGKLPEVINSSLKSLVGVLVLVCLFRLSELKVKEGATRRLAHLYTRTK